VNLYSVKPTRFAQRFDIFLHSCSKKPNLWVGFYGERMNRLINIILIMMTSVIGFMASDVWGQSLDIPGRIQAATFSKVFKYSTRLRGTDPIRLLIVHNGRQRRELDELMQAFNNAAVVSFDVSYQELNQKIDSADVVYFMPGLENYTDICKQKEKLSISAYTPYTEKGNVSISMGLVQDRPRLFVHLSSLSKEGHDLSASILKISQVFR
jgi:molybdopterin converting factor small subunit